MVTIDVTTGGWTFIEAIDGVSIEGGLPIKFRNAEGDVELPRPRP